MQKKNYPSDAYTKTRLGRAMFVCNVRIKIVLLITGIAKPTLYAYLKLKPVEPEIGLKCLSMAEAMEEMQVLGLYPNDDTKCSDHRLLEFFNKYLAENESKYAVELSLAKP